jgi:hypothetical protein
MPVTPAGLTLSEAAVPTTSRYALSIHCPDCDSRQDLDEQVTVASAEVVVFVAAHSGHDRLSFHLQLPDTMDTGQLTS